MPVYCYKHPLEEKYIEVVQSMKDEHKFIDENGLEWERVWTVPQSSVDGKWSIWDSKDFAQKSANKKGTIGDLWDKAAELSAARADKMGGADPVKERMYKEYEKQNRGKPHPHKVLENQNKTCEVDLIKRKIEIK